MLDLDLLLAPFPGENPAGEDLRYRPVYDEIKEARRADDALDRGDWQHELKVSDWDRVIQLSVQALSEKSKDLQIAAWLAEALVKTRGFAGLIGGLKLIGGLLTGFWEELYPGIEDGDLEFRAAPLEFANTTLGFIIREIPLTDPRTTPGYSWIKWQESRTVGYEENAKDKAAREEMIADGKIPAELFDGAVARSSKEFCVGLAERIGEAREVFASLDAIVDERFGGDAPLISEIDKALADCERLVSGILKEKRAGEPDETAEAPPEEAMEAPGSGHAGASAEAEPPGIAAPESPVAAPAGHRAVPLSDFGGGEEAVWKEALAQLKSSGLKPALARLMGAAYTAASPRQRSRYRLLMAKLCLQARRPDLARPLMEELFALVEEMNLARWESPIWIADVLDTLRRCLAGADPDSEDAVRAKDLLKRICTLDVTQAIE